MADPVIPNDVALHRVTIRPPAASLDAYRDLCQWVASPACPGYAQIFWDFEFIPIQGPTGINEGQLGQDIIVVECSDPDAAVECRMRWA